MVDRIEKQIDSSRTKQKLYIIEDVMSEFYIFTNLFIKKIDYFANYE